MNRIVSIKINTLFLSAILIAGTIALSSPSFMAGAQAQQDYGIENNYDKKSNGKDVSVKSIKCNNVNVNVNGLELNGLPPFLNNLLASDGQDGYGDASSYGSGSYGNVGQSGYDNNSFKFVCINNNNNTVIGEGEEPIPPEPSEPTTATLTVNKEVFGCDNSIVGNNMDCQQMTNTDTAWLPCINSVISNYLACLGLPPSLFDIEVLDNQGNQLQQFEGSTQGTTIENLQPGTYTVNEIKYPSNINQLGESLNDETTCGVLGFDDGGTLENTNAAFNYIICIEYEDEQGNDCKTLTLAAGEEKTCTVKNYIRQASQLMA